jgi:hypothetical protein
MNFSQNKKDLNAEHKKTARLEQCIREMESALAAGTIPKPLTFTHLLSSAKAKSVNIATLAANQDANLAKQFDSQLNLSTSPDDTSAKVISITMDDVGGWCGARQCRAKTLKLLPFKSFLW